MGVVSMLVIWALWGIATKRTARWNRRRFSFAYVVLGALALPIIAITGHLGGVLTSGS